MIEARLTLSETPMFDRSPCKVLRSAPKWTLRPARARNLPDPPETYLEFGAKSWARLILDRRRDLINDRPSRAAAAEAPLDGARERHHFDNPTNHSRGAFYHGEEA